jgi:ADP-ribose pyrophosphatase YjhB (NUDIX family)
MAFLKVSSNYCSSDPPPAGSVELKIPKLRQGSYGVLVSIRERRLLLGHAKGTRHWDIPKGVGNPGEPPRATPVREAAEETGVRLDAPRLLELGVFAYLPNKSLHLFAVMIDEVEATGLSCTSILAGMKTRVLAHVRQVRQRVRRRRRSADPGDAADDDARRGTRRLHGQGRPRRP